MVEIGPRILPALDRDLAEYAMTLIGTVIYVPPRDDEPGKFVPFAGDLEDILCVQHERVVAGDNTVRYNGRTLQIPADRHRHHYVKATVRVHEYPDGSLAVFHGPRCLARFDGDGNEIENRHRKAA